LVPVCDHDPLIPEELFLGDMFLTERNGTLHQTYFGHTLDGTKVEYTVVRVWIGNSVPQRSVKDMIFKGRNSWRLRSG
jgi:hypothetical protein